MDEREKRAEYARRRSQQNAQRRRPATSEYGAEWPGTKEKEQPGKEKKTQSHHKDDSFRCSGYYSIRRIRILEKIRLIKREG